MGFIKNLFAFILGIIIMFLFYYLVNIPIIPCISIYAIALLFSNSKIKSRIFFIIIGTIIGTCFYSINAILSIKYYPKYLNILGIIFEFITAFSMLSAGLMHYKLYKQELEVDEISESELSAVKIKPKKTYFIILIMSLIINIIVISLILLITYNNTKNIDKIEKCYKLDFDYIDKHCSNFGNVEFEVQLDGKVKKYTNCSSIGFKELQKLYEKQIKKCK